MQKILMCFPSHYDIEYVINPWMKGSVVDPKKAVTEWKLLLNAYKDLGIEVEIIDQKPGLPDMVFAADQGIVFGENNILLSNFRYKQRKGESKIYSDWYKEHGYKVQTLPENLFFEGNGELQKWREKLLVGTGFRTTKEASLKISEILKTEVVPIELVNERFYHLDTCLFVLNDDVVFYYPKAISAKSILELKKMVPNLIEVSKKEAFGFATNSVVIGKNVILQKGNNKMAKDIQNLGFNTVELDVSEFIKAGGGIHCLTGVL